LRHLISDTETELLPFELSSNYLRELSDENPNIKIAPESTATLFFTSGTTGTPKGVMASYNNVSHYVNVANTRFQSVDSDIIPAIARLTFSISIFELLSPIFAGATLVLLPRASVLDLNEMSHLLERVTVIHMGPSLLSVLVQFIQSQNQKNRDRCLPLLSFDNLRHISSGGDMVPVELLWELQKIFLNAEIYVIYGCSEISCMGVTQFYRLDETINKTLVGFAFDNVAVNLLDDNLNLVPQGAIGNVYFSGDGVTKGYWQQPNLTQQKYITIDGLRYYDTGDRGRFNCEGALEFLGRKDFQIQVHGIRIELGEIESILKQLPMVKDGVIAQKKLADGKKKIIAYVIENQPSNQLGKNVITDSIILEDLSKLLPDYMMPDHIYFMDEFPLNHNFKLDSA